MIDLTLADLQAVIEAGWASRDTLGVETTGPVRTAVEECLRRLDAGETRVAEKIDGAWQVRQWLKQAILLSFRLSPNVVTWAGGIGPWWDKVPGKFEAWEEPQFEAAGFRAVPGAVVRRGAFIGRNAVLMPSFVNIGAYVGEGAMVDTWATVGSCAQIGKGVHLSGGAGIGGVLEPLQAAPAPRWPRGSSSARARCSPWASFSAPPPRSSTARPARPSGATSLPIRWWCRERCPTRMARAPASPAP